MCMHSVTLMLWTWPRKKGSFQPRLGEKAAAASWLLPCYQPEEEAEVSPSLEVLAVAGAAGLLTGPLAYLGMCVAQQQLLGDYK